MVIYETRWFHRWARKHGISSESLCLAVDEMMSGTYEADLGGGVIKKRIARKGQGKSGGFRTLVATNQGNLWVFIFGFAKNERSNVDPHEQIALKRLAKELLTLKPQDLIKAEQASELIKVNCSAQEKIRHH